MLSVEERGGVALQDGGGSLEGARVAPGGAQAAEEGGEEDESDEESILFNDDEDIVALDYDEAEDDEDEKVRGTRWWAVCCRGGTTWWSAVLDVKGGLKGSGMGRVGLRLTAAHHWHCHRCVTCYTVTT